MKIILTQSIDTLGKAGDIVNVKPGYGRNYLIPRGFGVIATPAMIRATKQEIERKAMKEAKSKENLQVIADKLNTVSSPISSSFSRSNIFYTLNIRCFQLAKVITQPSGTVVVSAKADGPNGIKGFIAHMEGVSHIFELADWSSQDYRGVLQVNAIIELK